MSSRDWYRQLNLPKKRKRKRMVIGIVVFVLVGLGVAVVADVPVAKWVDESVGVVSSWVDRVFGGQEWRVMRFEQLPDGSVQFHIQCRELSRAWDGGEFVRVKLVMGGEVEDAKETVLHVGSELSLVASPQAVRKMLEELSAELRTAEKELREYTERANWDGLFKGKMWDYNWVKAVEEDQAGLEAIVTKWSLLRQGLPVDWPDLAEFCERFLEVKMEEVAQ